MMLLQTCEFSFLVDLILLMYIPFWKLLSYYTISNINEWINTISVKSLAYNRFSFGHVKLVYLLLHHLMFLKTKMCVLEYVAMVL
jgi:hypothetical protein